MGKHLRTLAVFCGALIVLCWLGQGRLRSFLHVRDSSGQADAIVLLAGRYEERMPAALARFHAGKYGRILLTDDGVRRGWSREHQRNLYTTERGVYDLVRQGVPRQSIAALPFFASGTVYDALAVKEYVLRNNIRSILLVTSDYHTRRSLWIFQRVFRQTPVTVAVVAVPSSAALFPDILLEYIKCGYYQVRFGLFNKIPTLPS